MKFINNEKGAALIYVIMISVVLTTFLTVILMTTTNSQKAGDSSEKEKIVTNLAVSGMQSLLRYHLPGQQPTVIGQLTFLKNNTGSYYGTAGLSIIQPKGDSVTYRQYLVLSTKTDTEALDLANIVVQSSIDPFNTLYKLVTTATVGDTNNNQQRDAGEYSFKIKSLIRSIGVNTASSLKDILSYSFPQQTGPATIDTANRTIIIEVTAVTAGTNLSNLVATFTVSPGATIKVGSTSQTSGTGGTTNNFSNSTTTPFVYTITAADGTTNNWTVVVTQVGGVGDNGIVWNVAPDGTRTPQVFGDTLISSTTLLISSSIGTVSSSGNYTFQATNGIVIEPGVNLTSTGTNSTVSLASSAGSITIPSTFLKTSGNGNNSPYDIAISAALDLDIRGATIEAQRDISLSAGRKIYAQNATVNNFKNNGAITFTITNASNDPTNSKILYVDGLKVNQATTAGSIGVKICGTTGTGSRPINGFNSFTGGYCN
jgi:hypothetical protein